MTLVVKCLPAAESSVGTSGLYSQSFFLGVLVQRRDSTTDFFALYRSEKYSKRMAKLGNSYLYFSQGKLTSSLQDHPLKI